MKKIFSNNKFWLISLLIGLFAASITFIGCKSNDYSATAPISVNAVYLENAKSDVPDRLVTFVRLGSAIRIEGTGFSGLKKVYINGYDTYFNPSFVTDNSMLISVSGYTPTIDAASGTRNTIRFVKDGTEFTYSFEIRSAAPSITSISNTLPAAGDTITIYGTGLTEISKITFPGSVVVSQGIISDKLGTYCKVVIPAGLTKSGSILVQGSNGGAYSPAYFYCKSGVILNFDDIGSQGYWSWTSTGSMINNTDLESAAVVGAPVASQGKYCAHRPSRIAQFPAAKNRISEVWTSGSGTTDDWRTYLTSLVPTTTAVSNFAFQFDIYVPNEWNNTGFLKICLMNNFNGGEWSGTCYNYVPWIVNGVTTPFKTKGWVTVTIPFSNFYAFSSTSTTYTFEDVITAREKATYKNFGIYFENSDIKLSTITGKTTDTTVFTSSATSVSVYTDNWRIVPLTQPTYSDY
jgi:hypothetical protein